MSESHRQSVRDSAVSVTGKENARDSALSESHRQRVRDSAVSVTGKRMPERQCRECDWQGECQRHCFE